MVSTSFPHYQLETIVGREVDAFIARCDDNRSPSSSVSAELHVTGIVTKARALGDGRYVIGGIHDELEGIIYAVIWDPATDVSEIIEEE